MPKTIQPTEEYIFAKKVEVETKTASGLLLSSGPDETQKKMLEVINVGKDIKDISAKDIILYIPTASSVSIKLGGKDYMVVHKTSVIGVVKEVEDAQD